MGHGEKMGFGFGNAAIRARIYNYNRKNNPAITCSTTIPNTEGHSRSVYISTATCWRPHNRPASPPPRSIFAASVTPIRDGVMYGLRNV